MAKTQIFSKIHKGLLVLSCLLASPLHAKDIALSDVPPLYQLTVFKSEIDPDHYIILGKDQNFADAGNWYVLNWKSGAMTSPALKQESFHWYGGGFDFKFESGEWLYIPDGNSGTTAPGATHEIIPSGLIDPNRGREPLQKVDVTKELIDQLGLRERVAEKFLNELDQKKEFESSPKTLAKNEGIVLIVVSYDYSNVADRDLTRSLRDRLQGDGEKSIHVEDTYGETSALYIWAFESQAKLIEQWVRDELKKTPAVYKRIIDLAAKGTPLVNTEQLYESEAVQSLPAIAATFDAIEASIGKMKTVELEKAAEDIFQYLYRLEWILGINSRSEHSLSFFENSMSAQQQLSVDFTDPLKNLMSRGYEILHKMNTAIARKILFFSGEDRLSSLLRVSFLNRPSGVASEAYFQTWLRLLKEKVEWVHKATPSERQQIRIPSSMGGILRQFGFLSIEVRDYIPQAGGRLWQLDENRNMFPLLVFGLSDSPVYRAELARTIIEMDKFAELARVSFTRENDERIIGSRILMDLLGGLTYAAGYQSRTASIPGFSRPRYFAQVMMVISELLNTSRMTIKNSATYLTILDTAISLQKFVTEEFGIVPNSKSHTPELNDLTEQLIRLHQAVQIRMIRGVFLNPDYDRAPENCAAVVGAL